MINYKNEYEHSLERFVIAQNGCFDQVIKELRNEQKKTHWIWFIFPQLKGLGHSEYAHYYGVNGVEEAKLYLEHPILGPRLETCLQILEVAKSSAKEIFGDIDAKKFQSSLTLFLEVEPESPLLNSLLIKFYSGKKDQNSKDLLVAK